MVRFIHMKKFLASCLIAGAFTVSSCYQEPDPGSAIITVLDNNDFRVPEATVRFFQSGNGPGIIDQTRYSDGSGVATFLHGPSEYKETTGNVALCGPNAYCEVILNVRATGPSGAQGQAVVRIIPGEVARETIRIF
jgi:hypothetical protein